MKTIIINGANGFVASNFILQLLKQNYKVIALVRPDTQNSSEERMQAALMESSDGEFINTSKLKVYSYSLLHKNFSIPADQLQEIFRGEVDYYHFAASLKFDERSKEKIFSTNIGGVGNSIRVFSRFAKGNSRFFFISTAYTCGKFPGQFKEKFYPNEDIGFFRNYYEQSKRFAENLVKEHIDNHGLNAYVIRLSQVVGNNKTGVTKTDYGIFDFAKRMCALASRYPHQTLRVHVNPESTQNLIPIDTVINYLIRTIEVQQIPTIINFVAKNQIKNSHIVKTISSLLPVTIVPVKQLARREMNALERIVAAGMTFTESYIDTNLQCDTKNLDQIRIDDGQEVSEDSVYKMLDYFIGNIAQQKRKRALVSTL